MLGDKLGVDQERLRAALLDSSAGNWALKTRPEELPMPWAEKDMRIVLAEADRLRVSVPLCGVVKEVVKTVKFARGWPTPRSAAAERSLLPKTINFTKMPLPARQEQAWARRGRRKWHRKSVVAAWRSGGHGGRRRARRQPLRAGGRAVGRADQGRADLVPDRPLRPDRARPTRSPARFMSSSSTIRAASWAGRSSMCCRTTSRSPTSRAPSMKSW